MSFGKSLIGLTIKAFMFDQVKENHNLFVIKATQNG